MPPKKGKAAKKRPPAKKPGLERVAADAPVEGAAVLQLGTDRYGSDSIDALHTEAHKLGSESLLSNLMEVKD